MRELTALFSMVRRRNWMVGVPAVVAAIAFAHAVLAAHAVPFPTSVPLATVIELAWLYAVAKPPPPGVAVAIVWIVPTAAFALSGRRNIRWMCIGLAAFTGLPGGLLFIGQPVALWEGTLEVFTRPLTGESWEFVPFAVAAWWLVLWLFVALCECLWPPGAESAPRGFAPIVVADMGGTPMLREGRL